MLPRALAALLAALVLAGCTATPPPKPTATVDIATACAEAAAGVVDAVAELVAGYETPLVGEASETPAPLPDPTPSPDETDSPDLASGDPLADAVAKARQQRDELGCDPDDFDAELEHGLAGIKPDGPIADAVWRRTTASILGRVQQAGGERTLAAGEDLRDVLATAADGTTVVLPAGTTDVDSTLVALSGVTLRGAGRDATTIRSTAAEAALIVATPSVVRLEGLTIEVAASGPASGVIAGPSASLALTGVRVAGATAEGEGAGGAGVYLSATGAEASGRGTTLEVTDSVFERNAWVGIAVTGGHRVSIETSTFAGNATAGIMFLDTSTGSVNTSTFTDNGVGFAAAGAATPTWLGSTVTGGSVGAQVDGTAAPVIENLRVSAVATAAVIFGGQSQGWATGTTCEGVPHGIVIADTAAPTLGDNDCPLARGG